MGTRAAPLLLVIATLPLAGCGGREDGFIAAQGAFAAGKYGEAKLKLVRELRDHPRDERSLQLLARTLVRMGDPDGTLIAVGRLRATGKGGAAADRFEAEARLLAGDPRAALAALGHDGHSDAWRIRATAYLQLNQPAEAIEAFEHGMAAGSNPLLAADYARFRIATLDYPAAHEILRLMRKRTPGAFETMMLAGGLAVARGNDRLALKEYQAAAAAYPARHEALLAQAQVLERIGWIDQAIAFADKASELAPQTRDVTAVRLRLLAVKGDWTKVRDLLQPVEGDLDPVSGEGMTYGEALLRLGRAEQARALFSRSVLLSPHNRFARSMLGEAQMATGDAPSAFETLRPLADTVLVSRRELALLAAAAKAAAHPEALPLARRLASPEFRKTSEKVRLGEAAMMRGDWQAARDIYLSLPGHEHDADLLLRLAMTNSHLGKTDEAIAYADKAVAAAPWASSALHVAGQVRVRGDRDLAAAIELLRRAVRIEPGNSEYLATLRRAEAAAG